MMRLFRMCLGGQQAALAQVGGGSGTEKACRCSHFSSPRPSLAASAEQRPWPTELPHCTQGVHSEAGNGRHAHYKQSNAYEWDAKSSKLCSGGHLGGKASVHNSSIDAASSSDQRIPAGQPQSAPLHHTQSAPLPLAQLLHLQQQSEQRTSVSDQASTSYLPAEGHDELWVEIGDFMCSATEMEATIDGLLEGSNKSARAVFARYDMDRDGYLKPQDYYDCMLELALALPYVEYQRFVDWSFAWADGDKDGRLSVGDFVPLYQALAAARRAFRRQDHHSNGQIDKFDFAEVVSDLELVGRVGEPRAVFVERSFRLADRSCRGSINFGQFVVWYFWHLHAYDAGSTWPRER